MARILNIMVLDIENSSYECEGDGGNKKCEVKIYEEDLEVKKSIY